MVERIKARLEGTVARITPVRVTSEPRAERGSENPGQAGQPGSLGGLVASRPKPKVAHVSRSAGRLVLALGATQSRASTWGRAMAAQSALFHAIADGRHVAVSLACYNDYGPLKTSTFTTDPRHIERAMRSLRCGDGRQQIGAVLDYALACSAAPGGLAALVLIADCVIQEYDHCDVLIGKGRQLTKAGTQTFVVHDQTACNCWMRFDEIARGMGALCTRLGAGTPAELNDLFGAIGAYAGGGLEAMRTAAKGDPATGLVRQLERFNR